MFEAAKLFDVVENFADGIDDAVDIFFSAKEKMMGEPDGFVIGGALGHGTLIHVAQIERLGASPTQSRIIGWIEREERAAIDGLVEESVAGDAFELQGGYEGGAGNVFHLLGVILHHVAVGSEAGDARFGLE